MCFHVSQYDHSRHVRASALTVDSHEGGYPVQLYGLCMMSLAWDIHDCCFRRRGWNMTEICMTFASFCAIFTLYVYIRLCPESGEIFPIFFLGRRYTTYLWSSITTCQLWSFFKLTDIALYRFLGRVCAGKNSSHLFPEPVQASNGFCCLVLFIFNTLSSNQGHRTWLTTSCGPGYRQA